MTALRLNGIAFLVMLASLPLIALGTDGDTPALWWTGAVLLAVALVVPTATRWMGDDDEGDDG
jgi:Kef-type K+ transport system membrane component KefB